MTKKVMLTREQAEALKVYKENEHNVAIFAANWRGFHGIYEFLKTFSIDEMARLLYEPNSYEVEPKYQVGDWVVYPSFDDGNVIVKIIDIQYVHFRVQFETLSGWKAIRDIDRHATPEEIKTEKERRLWKSIGRKGDKFHNGDFGISYDGERSDFVPRLIDLHSEGKLLGFYPAESFISFEEVDSE